MTSTVCIIGALACAGLIALCGSAVAEEDYSTFRVLDTRVIDMVAGPAGTAALLSPDGSRVLHIGSGNLCLVAPAQVGSWAQLGCVQTTFKTRPRLPEDMMWSPDSTSLLMPTFGPAFAYFDDTDIEVLDPATLSTHNLTDDGVNEGLMKLSVAANLDVAARWVDANTIVFVRYQIPAEGYASHGLPELMLIERDGTNERKLLEIPAPNGFSVYTLAVSGDGARIAYAIDDKDNAQVAGIWILDMATKQAERLAPMADVGPPPVGLAFSADGTMLLMVGPNEEGGIAARVLELVSGAIAPVDATQNVIDTAWSPTGSALAYIVSNVDKPDAPAGLFLADKPGKPGRLLIGAPLMASVCCGKQPFTWASNNTMTLGRVGDTDSVLFVQLGK